MMMIIFRTLVVLGMAVAAIGMWNGEVMALISAPFMAAIDTSRPLGANGPFVCGTFYSVFTAPQTYFASMLAAYPLAILSLRGAGRFPAASPTSIEKLRSMLMIGVLPFVASAGLVYAMLLVAARLYLPGATHLFGETINSTDLASTARGLTNFALLLMLPTALLVQIGVWKIALRRRRASA